MVANSLHMISELNEEIKRQNIKWGEQNHPVIHKEWADSYKLEADGYRIDCDYYAKEGHVTWGDILLEEVYEALAETNTDKQIEEFIQVAAVALQIAASIDRNREDK